MLLFNATTTVVPSTRGHSRDTIVEEETYQTQTNFTVDAAMLPNVLVGYVTLQGITLFSPECSWTIYSPRQLELKAILTNC